MSSNEPPAPPIRLEAPQALAIGMTSTPGEDGIATGQLPWREDLVGEPSTGVLAGGAVTTLLDHVCGASVFSAMGADPRREGVQSIATLDLRIDYMRAATPGKTITGRAHCYRVTRSIAFVRAIAHDGDEADPVATVQAAFAVNRGNGA